MRSICQNCADCTDFDASIPFDSNFANPLVLRFFYFMQNENAERKADLSLILRLEDENSSRGAIERICEEVENETVSDRSALVRAARCLLGAVTRVLLLADIVVVKQLLLAKDKVWLLLIRILKFSSFDNE
ncbi:hypothetical protein Trydic_g12030 [Trypoxylus dichotomus]